MVNYHLLTGRIITLSGNEKIAKILGYAGLIPFIIFSIGSWIEIPYLYNTIYVLITYAAIILSFMGAIHWGMAMSKTDNKQNKYFITSVIPALAAWFSLLIPEFFSLIVLLIGFILLISYDLAVEKPQGFPNWYIPMRIKLTFVVLLSLVSALLSIFKSGL